MKTIKALLIVCLTVLTVSVSAQQMKPHHQIIKDCSVCHTKENAVKGNEFVKPNNASCQSCHGSYEDLGKLVQNKIKGEPNPHTSAHYGSGIECTACHKEHRPSVVYCNNCHEFKYQMK